MSSVLQAPDPALCTAFQKSTKLILNGMSQLLDKQLTPVIDCQFTVFVSFDFVTKYPHVISIKQLLWLVMILNHYLQTHQYI